MTNYSLLERNQNTKPAWADEVLLAWNDEEFSEKEPFMTSHYWTAQGSMNVFNVVGTACLDYQHQSWMNLLENGKKMHLNLPLLESNPGYYHNTDIKQPTMYFKTMNGLDFYIDHDGNHRTCLARFYFYELGLTQLHGVTLNHYKIDEVYFTWYQELLAEISRLKLNVFTQPKRIMERREDTAGWKTDFFRTEIKWIENGKEQRLNREDMPIKLAQLRHQKQGFFNCFKR